MSAALLPVAAATLVQTVVEGPPPQDPGLVPYVPAAAFVVLAAVVWWIWRRIAGD